MKKRLMALLLAVAVLLSGCSGSWESYLEKLRYSMMGIVFAPFDQLEYIRPDLEWVDTALNQALEAAQGKDFDQLINAILDYNSAYGSFYTNFMLAYIHYSKDLRDLYWEEEYNFCQSARAEVDGGSRQLYHALAHCSHRQALEGEAYFGSDFFDAYENNVWDEEFTTLVDAENQLISQFYALSQRAQETQYYSEEFFNEYGVPMTKLYVELIALRQQIAARAGFDSYASYAYQTVYYRDYTPAQADIYLEQIRKELVPLYEDLYWNRDLLEFAYEDCAQAQMESYVADFTNAMGGTVKKAYDHMQTYGLYDVTGSEYKYDASFEVFLTSFHQPYIFVNPEGIARDRLTFAHEFGHFTCDYAALGSQASVDVAEVFSQGMEYLSLFYAGDTEELELIKMADSLCVFVEQAAYAAFENQVYSLEGEALTAENVVALYGQILEDYGMTTWGRDSRDLVLINHFYTNPMYIMSYVVSNDAAMQLYQLEQARAGAGLEILEANLATTQTDFLAFVEQAGLRSPFSISRMKEIRQTFEDVLGLAG